MTAITAPTRLAAHAAASAKRAAPRRHNPTWTLILVCAAVFMLLLDLTIVSVALGNIQGAIFTKRTGAAATSDLAGQATPARIGTLADAIASGAGTKVTAAVPAPMRAALAQVARGATASGLDSVLVVGALACALACALATVVTVVLIGTDHNRAAVHGGTAAPAGGSTGPATHPQPALPPRR